MSSLQYPMWCFCFLSLTELISFQVLGKAFMDYGIKGGKSLNLGMAMAPQDIQEYPKTYAWGCPGKASPLSSWFIGNFTWSYIFIRYMIYVLLGASFMI